MGKEDLRDWDTPEVAERALAAIDASVQEMSKAPGSGIAMCHEQGKTAVYLSEDGKHAIEHAPDGTITRNRLVETC